MTLAAPALIVGHGVTWWFAPRLGGVNRALLYVGVGALSTAWLGMGRWINRAPRDQAPRLAALRLIGALWCLPLLVAPALFSRDVYSYLAQGTILHLGLSPYHNAPTVLAHYGHSQVLDAVGTFWRGTTAPYGPLFLGVVSLVAGVVGSHLIVGVLLLRLLEVVGIVLIAIFVPRLAAGLGADPARALWLAVLSPLTMLELLGAAHNDALMVGLMVAGVTLAVERRPVQGIALCALAAAIKVPAGIAALFIAVAWARAQPDMRASVRVLVQAALTTIAILLLVSVLTGIGPSWLSTSVFSTPQRVRLAITPSTSLGWTAAALLKNAGVAVNARHLESILGVVAFALIAAYGLVLLRRVRWHNVVRYLGLLLLAAAAGGPVAWPWYFTWGLVLIAACPETTHLRAIALLVAVSAFLVKANGTLVLPLQSAPVLLALYALAGAAAWHGRRRKAPARRLADFRTGALARQ